MNTCICPTCEKKFEAEKSSAMPFCSERCRLIDLAGWLDEKIGLPVVDEEESFLEEDSQEY